MLGESDLGSSGMAFLIIPDGLVFAIVAVSATVSP
jgi:hypothetical protein